MYYIIFWFIKPVAGTVFRTRSATASTYPRTGDLQPSNLQLGQNFITPTLSGFGI